MGYIIAVTVLCAAILFAAASIIYKLFFRKTVTRDGFTVTAHSGCMGLPDNSLEAMEAGINAGADIVEFDLNYTAEGEPVLSHNKPAPDDNCVTLREAFEFLAKHPGIKANVDVKSTEHLETVKPLAEETGVLSQIFFTGVGESFVPDVKDKAPGIPYYLNLSGINSVKAAADKVEKAGAIGINLNHSSASASLCREMHRRSLLASVWTVNTKMKARYVLGMKPDNITTRQPDMLCALLKKAGKAE